MRKFLILIFCVFLLALSVFAADLKLSYDEWLEFYQLENTLDNAFLYDALVESPNTDTKFPVYVAEDVYEDYRLAGVSPVLAGDAVDSLVRSDSESNSSGKVPSESSLKESPVSEVSPLSVQPTPSSGLSYIMPQLVETKYYPDAEAGTLLSALYGILGKPIMSQTWQVKTGYSSSSEIGYITENYEFDSAWIASFILLCAVIICIFKLGGGLLCKM